LLAQMSVSDEISMVEGHGTSNPYVFYTPAIPSLCIPQVGEEDGPAGVADGLTGVTQLPAGVALAASFDPTLGRQYGNVIGQEEWGKGAAVNLGPTINIDRDPRWGRSFETLTEDPFLNESLGVPEINGVQSQREMSQVKHYDAYNQETNRNTPQDDVIVSDRALHEIYMPGFEAAVKRANVASVMCAYSSVNGRFSCENGYLLNDTLRELWGFPGFVTSDYAAIHNLSAATAGTDQEQPFNTYFGAPLQNAVTSGAIPRRVLNAMVSHVLTQMFRFDLFRHPPTGTTSDTVTTPAHVAVANAVADAGTTLLKNQHNALPMSTNSQGTVAVIGPGADSQPTYAGGGSAYVIPSGTVSPLHGLQAAARPGTNVVYRQGLPNDTSLDSIPSSDLTPAYTGTPFNGSYSGTLTAPETGKYVIALTNPCGCYTSTYLYLDGRELIDNPSTPPVHIYSVAVPLTAGQHYTVQINGDSSALTWATPSALAPGIQAAVNAAKSASRAVVVAYDDTESEATDRPSLDLPSAQDELISAVAAANPHTIVVLDAGAPVAMPWLSQVAAVVDAWYPGQTNGTSLADVLFGRVNPGGHLPVTFPASLAQVPAATPAQFPGVGGKVLYSEGVDVGYRWYDSHNLTPLFPFGFGLSYTRFAFRNLRVTPAHAQGTSPIQVTADVTNIGGRAGSEVAQLYLGDPASTGEPPRQLAGFQRVTLAPAHTAHVRFFVAPRQTWWWNGTWDGTTGWDQAAGLYHVYVGDSSALAGLPLRGTFTYGQAVGTRRVTVSAPQSVRPGNVVTITLTLSRGGTETLPFVAFSLPMPEGWLVRPLGPSTFTHVTPAQAPSARFAVEPPSWWPATNVPVHASASIGRHARRDAGVMLAVER
jgi:beta-glucosidase